MERPDDNRTIWLIQVLALILVSYILIVYLIQAYLCPDLEPAELYRLLDEAVFLRFKDCNP